MNILTTSLVGKARCLFRALLVGFLVVGPVLQTKAAIYTITDSAGYGAIYDTSFNGFTSWSAGGQNQLALQSLYYSINGGPVTLLTPASAATGNAGSGKKITVNYTVSDGTVQDVLTLIGNTLSESIKFSNTSGNDLSSVSIFQYSDFILGGPSAAGNQTVGLTPAPVSGGYAIANQNGGGLAFTWEGQATGFSTLVQADSSGNPFGAFTGSGDLDNITFTANNTSAVFGYEFSGAVAQGNSLSISENTAFPLPVPEPTHLALISLGMLAVALRFRQSKLVEVEVKKG